MHDEITKAAWRKASYCNGATACVEVAPLPDGGVALRDSKSPEGPTHRFTAGEWAAFVAGVIAGEFDLPVLHATAGDGSDGDARSGGASAVLAGSGGGSVPA